MPVHVSPLRRVYQTLASLRTGITLLIIVAIVSVIGTVVLQRPITETQDLERAYSPETLRLLDAIGLTDVFHAWWFALLMAVLSISIICASLDRWPNVWRFFSRPYRRTDPHFRAVLPVQIQIPVKDAGSAMLAAERAFRKDGLKPERIVENDEVSLYAERNRTAVLAAYVIHTSLLLILLGGIIDAVWGYKGYISLTPGSQTNLVPLRNAGGAKKVLPFSLRCDGTGQENYENGAPKKWWSKLVVVEGGREVYKKEIIVNDPLTWGGVTFYQSGWGRSDEPDSFLLRVVSLSPAEKSSAMPWQAPDKLKLAMNGSAQLDPNTTVRIIKFLPDAYEMDGEVYQRTKQLSRPAIQLEVQSRDKTGAASTRPVWLLWNAEAPAIIDGTPYALQMADIDFLNATGLQVSHEPGQWAVWAGCILMALGFVMAFYMVHMRLWAVTVVDAKGKLTLWVGGSANKHREAFEQRFAAITEQIRSQLETESKPCAVAQASSMAHV